MLEPSIMRQQIIDAIHTGLDREPFVLAIWLGGSDASGRTDALSDIDLQIIVEDDRVEDAFIRVHELLGALSPIEHRYRFPEPTWHGHSQELLCLRDADPDHFLDLVVMKRGASDRLLERERHGEAMILVDREHLLEPPPFDWERHRRRMEQRLADLRVMFPLMQPMVTRGARRGQIVESAYGYQAHTLKPLIELLRMRHCPARFDFGPRYLDRDLPADWRERFEQLAYPASAAALIEMHRQAVGHFEAELAAFDRGEWGLPSVPGVAGQSGG